MFESSAIIGPGLPAPATIDVYAWNRSGSTRAIGDVVQFVLNVTAHAEVTSADFGKESSMWANYHTPVAIAPWALGGYSFYGVVMESTPDNAKGRVRVQGEVERAFCIDAAASIAVGDPLTVTAAYNFNGALSNEEGVRAIALEALTTPTTRTLGRVLVLGLGPSWMIHTV